MTENISAAAASARENARSSNGKFGVQPASEADLELPVTMTVEQTVRARNALGLCLTDAQERKEDDFELSAAYQRATARMVGTALAKYKPEITQVAFVPNRDGEWRLEQASSDGYEPVDAGWMVPGTSTTWDEVGDSLLFERDGNHIGEALTCQEDGLIVLDVELAAQMDEEGTGTHPTTREAFVAWQKATRSADRLRGCSREFESTPEYTRLVQSAQRNAVKAAAVLLAQEHPEAKYLTIMNNEDGENQFDVEALSDADGNAIVTGMDASYLTLGNGSMGLATVGYAFVNRDGSYVSDVATHDVKGPDTRVITIDLTKAAAMRPEEVPARIAPVSDHDQEVDWDDLDDDED